MKSSGTKRSKNSELIEKAHSILKTQDSARFVEAAAHVVRGASADRKNLRIDDGNAIQILHGFVRSQLDRGCYQGVAKFLWGSEFFSPDPRSVRMVWEPLPTINDLVIIGAGSMGKSYSIAVWLILDWIRDPAWTCVKVVSMTEEHAKRNVFAHMRNLISNALVPMPGDKTDRSIQVNDDDKQGIHLLTIPAGEDGKGRLRGFHPVPRPEHPVFGKLSRVRAILDEAEEIPGGVWEDVDNMLITVDGPEHVKVIAATNPKDRNSKLGKRCEPKGGWSTLDVETAERWSSADGNRTVIRLDGARCENVTERKIVHPGLLTWDGYERYLKAGDTTPEYFTMARGWFPEVGLHMNVIPGDFIDKSRGMFIFHGATTYVAGVDLAFEGGDKAIMTVGRWGKVDGFTNFNGSEVRFPKPKHGLQIESQFELNKTDTLDMADQIKRICGNLRIDQNWLIVDRTGNGTGVHDALKTTMGANVMGLNFGEASTHTRVLDDDTQMADELYDGVVTELFFATRKFMEFNVLKMAPTLNIDSLTTQLTNRRFKQKKGLVRVESKKEYKARGNPSPDHADSLTLVVHLVRLRSEFTAQMLATQPQSAVKGAPKGTVENNLEFINFNDDDRS